MSAFCPCCFGLDSRRSELKRPETAAGAVTFRKNSDKLFQ
ncbi:hypothetical protein A2U01_0095860, partial [Trifolium medium]|nr:hypothetical protein [Trifolium medium]